MVQAKHLHPEYLVLIDDIPRNLLDFYSILENLDWAEEVRDELNRSHNSEAYKTLVSDIESEGSKTQSEATLKWITRNKTALTNAIVTFEDKINSYNNWLDTKDLVKTLRNRQGILWLDYNLVEKAPEKDKILDDCKEYFRDHLEPSFARGVLDLTGTDRNTWPGSVLEYIYSPSSKEGRYLVVASSRPPATTFNAITENPAVVNKPISFSADRQASRINNMRRSVIEGARIWIQHAPEAHTRVLSSLSQVWNQDLDFNQTLDSIHKLDLPENFEFKTEFDIESFEFDTRKTACKCLYEIAEGQGAVNQLRTVNEKYDQKDSDTKMVPLQGFPLFRITAALRKINGKYLVDFLNRVCEKKYLFNIENDFELVLPLTPGILFIYRFLLLIDALNDNKRITEEIFLEKNSAERLFLFRLKIDQPEEVIAKYLVRKQGDRGGVSQCIRDINICLPPAEGDFTALKFDSIVIDNFNNRKPNNTDREEDWSAPIVMVSADPDDRDSLCVSWAMKIGS